MTRKSSSPTPQCPADQLLSQGLSGDLNICSFSHDDQEHARFAFKKLDLLGKQQFLNALTLTHCGAVGVFQQYIRASFFYPVRGEVETRSSLLRIDYSTERIGF